MACQRNCYEFFRTGISEVLCKAVGLTSPPSCKVVGILPPGTRNSDDINKRSRFTQLHSLAATSDEKPVEWNFHWVVWVNGHIIDFSSTLGHYVPVEEYVKDLKDKRLGSYEDLQFLVFETNAYRSAYAGSLLGPREGFAFNNIRFWDNIFHAVDDQTDRAERLNGQEFLTKHAGKSSDVDTRSTTGLSPSMEVSLD